MAGEPRVEVVHRCPKAGKGLTPCCGRSPFELLGDRITLYDAMVTCPGPAVPSSKEPTE
jgi:hypothetical protein